MQRRPRLGALAPIALALVLSGCLATPDEGLRPSGLDGGGRDARSFRDSGHRDIGLYAGRDAEDEDLGDLDGGLPYYNWNEHVQPIVAAKCVRCHSDPPRENAPYAIVDYPDTRRDAVNMTVLAYQEMAVRVQDPNRPMPPREGMMPPVPEPLTADEIEIIRVWALLGGPEGPLDAGLVDTGVEDSGEVDEDAGEDGGIDAGQDSGEPPDTGVVTDGGGPNPLTGIGTPVSVAMGYTAAEGPAWNDTTGTLYFSDVAGNRIYELTPPTTVTTFRDPSNGANGLAWDNAGLLLACEHQNRRLSRTQFNGTVTTVAGEYMGDLLNSPNDVLVRPMDGMVYFTDPPIGLGARPREVSFNGLYRIDLTGGGLVAEYEFPVGEDPNGVGLSPDEGTLYVSDSTNGVVHSFAVAADGSLTGPTPFVTSGLMNPDGIAVDDDGNVFIAAQNGVYVYTPGGVLWGSIAIAGGVSNCVFAGPTRTTLYITARQQVYSVDMIIPGGF